MSVELKRRTPINVQGVLDYKLEFLGIATCKFDDHQWPIKIVNDTVVNAPPFIRESDKLNANVPDGLAEDIQEAERCHFAQSYKAASVMCRRAMQLALENFGVAGINGRTLGPLLAGARLKTPPLLSRRADALAEGIHDYGDGGAHKVGKLDPQVGASLIYAAVMVLNELFDPQGPAMQSKKDSNAP